MQLESTADHADKFDTIGADILGRILVVDDNEGNRDIMSRKLQRQGYTVETANSGVEALALIETGDFSLVVLDGMMPEMSGSETLKRSRLTRSGTELPVIIATARSAREDVVEALRQGANDYVTKPIDFPVAIARIGTLVNSHLGVRMLRQANQAMRDVSEQLEKEIFERERAEDKALHLARHDPLTGLGNRAKLFKVLAGAICNPAGYAELYCLDLDAFRAINDKHGYATGDAILKAVAVRLQDSLESDGCVARLGGDEFLILRVLDAAPEDDAAFGEALNKALSEPIKVGDTAHAVTAKVGRIGGRDLPKTVDEIMKAVDAMLYCGKTAGAQQSHAA